MAIKIRQLKIKPCVDCGSDPVSHGREKTIMVVNHFLAGVLSPFDIFRRLMIPVFDRVVDRVAPAVARFLAGIKFGEIVHEPSDKDSLRTQFLWKEAIRRGIKMKQFLPLGLYRHLFFAEYGGKTFAFEGLPRPTSAFSGLDWMDNKAEMKKRFKKAGFPVAPGTAVFSEKEALKWFEKLSKPLIAKPHVGSATRHTTLHVGTEKEMIDAFRKAKQLSPFVIVEEELDGPVFRPTVVNGKLVAVLQRNPPIVIGDGVHTVSQLIEVENKRPVRQGPHFSKISISAEVLDELQRQGLKLESVPEKDRSVRLHQKINWGIGGSTKDVTDEVHPDNRKLFEDISHFIKDPLVGIDFIVADISRPWHEQKRAGVIECNSLPFIDNHHLPFEGEPRNVAGAIWEMIFPEARESK